MGATVHELPVRQGQDVQSERVYFDSLMDSLTQASVHAMGQVKKVRQSLKNLLKMNEGKLCKEFSGMESDDEGAAYDVSLRLKALDWYVDRNILGNGGVFSAFQISSAMQSDKFGCINEPEYRYPKVLDSLKRKLNLLADKIAVLDVAHLITHFSRKCDGGYYFDYEKFQQVNDLTDDEMHIFGIALECCGIIEQGAKWFFCEPGLGLLVD